MSSPLVCCFRLRFQFSQVDWIGYHLSIHFLSSQILVCLICFFNLLLNLFLCIYAFAFKNYYSFAILVEFWEGTGIIVHMNLLLNRSPELFSFPFSSQIPFLNHRPLHLLSLPDALCPIPLPHLINLTLTDCFKIILVVTSASPDPCRVPLPEGYPPPVEVHLLLFL